MSRYIDADAAAEELRTLYGLTENDHEDYIVASAIEAIQALECQPWRSVADDPPDADIDVLLLYRHNMAVGGRFTTDDLRVVWYVNSDDGYYTTTDSAPLYWMPLPDAPEKED